jgi:hypothetical protein
MGKIHDQNDLKFWSPEALVFPVQSKGETKQKEGKYEIG